MIKSKSLYIDGYGYNIIDNTFMIQLSDETRYYYEKVPAKIMQELKVSRDDIQYFLNNIEGKYEQIKK